MDEDCPCRSGVKFGECCQPYLSGTVQAPTAEALMRSRYSAFCLGKVDYLVATHHPDARSADEKTEVAQTVMSTRWTNLLVLEVRRGGEDDDDGTVKFAAASQSKSPLSLTESDPPVQQMHERSFFVREEGRWFYVDGDQLSPYRPKRNEPCWCGSGKKTKQCHG